MDGLNTVLEYLTSVPAWYLATSVDGQPHVRPFSFAQIQDGKLWFVTARSKDVWQELLQNQRFEATSWWPGHGWLILRGRQRFEPRCMQRFELLIRGMEVARPPRARPAPIRHGCR